MLQLGLSLRCLSSSATRGPTSNTGWCPRTASPSPASRASELVHERHREEAVEQAQLCNDPRGCRHRSDARANRRHPASRPHLAVPQHVVHQRDDVFARRRRRRQARGARPSASSASTGAFSSRQVAAIAPSSPSGRARRSRSRRRRSRSSSWRLPGGPGRRGGRTRARPGTRGARRARGARASSSSRSLADSGGPSRTRRPLFPLCSDQVTTLVVLCGSRGTSPGTPSPSGHERGEARRCLQKRLVAH